MFPSCVRFIAVAGVPASRVRYPTKALIIGLNYRGKGPKRELDGCINDAMCLQKFLELQGWPTDRRQMMVMTDDSVGNTYPSRQNVISALQWLMEGASPGDALFFSFSGHGGQVVDTSGDEADGMDEVWGHVCEGGGGGGGQRGRPEEGLRTKVWGARSPSNTLNGKGKTTRSQTKALETKRMTTECPLRLVP